MEKKTVLAAGGSRVQRAQLARSIDSRRIRRSSDSSFNRLPGTALKSRARIHPHTHTRKLVFPGRSRARRAPFRPRLIVSPTTVDYPLSRINLGVRAYVCVHVEGTRIRHREGLRADAALSVTMGAVAGASVRWRGGFHRASEYISPFGLHWTAAMGHDRVAGQRRCSRGYTL